MAVEDIVIKIDADTDQLLSTVDILEKLGTVDKTLADQFRKDNAAFHEREEALTGITAASDSSKKSMDALSNAGKEVQKNVSFGAAAESANELGGALETTVDTSKRLTQQLRDLKDQLSKLALAGQENTAEFKTLAQQAGNVQLQINKTNKEIQLLGSRTSSITAITTAVRGLAGGFALAQGASALFGDKNKALEETLVKVQAAMLIMNGITEVSSVLQERAAIQTALYGGALKVVNGIQEAFAISSAAAWAAATAGISLIVTAIAGVIYYFTSADNAAEALNKKIAEQNKLLEDQIAFNNEESRRAIENLTAQKKLADDQAALLESQGKSLDDIFAKKKTSLDFDKQISDAQFAAAEKEKQRLTDLQIANDKDAEKNSADKDKRLRDIQAFLDTRSIIESDFNIKEQLLNAEQVKQQKDLDNKLSDERKKALEDQKKALEDQRRNLETAASQIKATDLKLGLGQLGTPEDHDKELADQKKFLDTAASQIADYDKKIGEGETESADHHKQVLEEKKRLDLEYLQSSAKIVDSLFQFSISSLDSELSALEDQHNNKLISDKKYAREKALIERKQAISEKAQAVFDIGIKTAEAIVNALAVPIGGEALAVLVAASAAIELAAVLAKPLPAIPAFATGTKKAPPGFKIVGEKGPELIYSRGGEAIIPHGDTDEIMKRWDITMPKIDFVSPQLPEFFHSGMEGYFSHMDNSAPDIDYDLLANKLGKVIEQHKKVAINIDEHGFEKKIMKGINRQQDISRTFKFNG